MRRRSLAGKLAAKVGDLLLELEDMFPKKAIDLARANASRKEKEEETMVS